MDIEENKKLGLFLKQVQNNIEKDKNYTIEESFLEAVSNLSDESKNIFFHDIAIDYISLGSLNYIECLKQIKNLNDIPYANAQHILGHDSLKIGNLEGALDYLIKVNDVDHDIYLNAQIDLAIVKEKLGNVDDAINIYQDIISKTDENDKIYAKAQQNLGSIYVDKKSYEHAEECFRKILSIHSACFADAQFGLGVIFAVRKQDLKAVDYYKNVSNEFTRTYSKARFNLGNIYHRLNREDLALRCYKEVHESEATLYLQAKYSIANIYLSLRNLEEAFFSLKEIPEKSEIYLYFHYQIEMILTIGHLNDKEKQNKYLNLINLVKIILKLLFVNSEFDTSIAHYTNLTVSKILLDAPQQKNPSLRLGMINFMNDPTEGGLLNEILKIDHNIKTDELAFISCFTLHHDSLNQFRLYSKENQQEATGLSLIFSRNFFETNFNAFGMINKINPQASKLEIKESKKENEQKIGLYRCIYLDHISGLIKVAQREEWSFHREYKKENKASLLEKNPEAEQKWQNYQAEILEIESKVTTHLKQLVAHVKLLNPQKLNDEEKELLAEILLPLRYLIKHMAFKEEQECRMIYVTQMDNPLIKYDENINRIYIDYEPSVMQNLEKIYLAPKAKGEKMVFEYLCSRGQEVRKGKAPVKVKISQNPFQ